MTLYELLGVSPEATADEIKAAYRARALEHHPDRGGNPERFKAIQAAWDVLKDPIKRVSYDIRQSPDPVPSSRPRRRSSGPPSPLERFLGRMAGHVFREADVTIAETLGPYTVPGQRLPTLKEILAELGSSGFRAPDPAAPRPQKRAKATDTKR